MRTWLAPVIQTTLSLKASLGRRRDPSSFRSASALNATAHLSTHLEPASSGQALECACMQGQSAPSQNWCAGGHHLSCKAGAPSQR